MRAIILAGLLAIVVMMTSPVCTAQGPDDTKAVQPTKVGDLRPELVKRWEKMTPEQRQQMRVRMAKWRSMTPEQREKIKQNMERFRNLTPEQKARLMEARRKWEKASPEVRARMKQQFEKWRAMTPEDRQRVMQHVTLAKELLKSDFDTLKQTPEVNREAARKDIHQKMRALMKLTDEQLVDFRKLSPEEQAAKLKELVNSLPADEHHEGHGERHKGPAPPGPTTGNPTPAPAN